MPSLRRSWMKEVEPTPHADRTTLIRRATLTLRVYPYARGVQAFLADNAPDASQK
jgi:hypothetical protein